MAKLTCTALLCTSPPLATSQPICRPAGRCCRLRRLRAPHACFPRRALLARPRGEGADGVARAHGRRRPVRAVLSVVGKRRQVRKPLPSAADPALEARRFGFDLPALRGDHSTDEVRLLRTPRSDYRLPLEAPSAVKGCNRNAGTCLHRLGSVAGSEDTSLASSRTWCSNRHQTRCERERSQVCARRSSGTAPPRILHPKTPPVRWVNN